LHQPFFGKKKRTIDRWVEPAAWHGGGTLDNPRNTQENQMAAIKSEMPSKEQAAKKLQQLL
jgi:hypothetical protein